ncbi:MAG TPA: antibiotic biosynthesis monooxygenase [Thermoanaerobaculia bacterium]|jgi:heme-degrading monooxygenase HmoA
MIARLWHGAVPSEKAEAYQRHLERTGLPDYRATPGNRGVSVLRRLEGGVAHFLLVSLWEDTASIRAFAGDDLERARYYPEDEEFLLELEPAVTHYEVVFGPELGSR